MKPRHHCTLCELDISNNRLTTAGILVFANALPAFHHLRVLRFADSEHLLPVSIFQKLCVAAEKSCVLHTLTLGSEIMDGSTFSDHGAVSGKDVDALLRYWWQEPVYIAAIDCIRFLLHLNHASLTDIFQSGCSSVHALRNILDNVQPDKQLEACFRILQLKPDGHISYQQQMQVCSLRMTSLLQPLRTRSARTSFYQRYLTRFGSILRLINMRCILCYVQLIPCSSQAT